MFVYWRLRTYYEYIKPKLCTCAQSRAKFQFEIVSINVIPGIVYFRAIISESSRNVGETTPRIS